MFISRRAETPPQGLEPPDELGQLARRALVGDEEATRAFLAAAATPMLSVVRRVLGGSNPEVEDVLQDALIGLLQSLPRFRGESRAVHFANRVALFTAMAARRRWRTRAQWITDAPWFDSPDGERGTSPLDAAIDNRRRAALRRVLDELPTKSAEVLAMHFVLGYTVDEIAAAAGVPVNTVWSRLRLGKEAFRRRIEADASLADDLVRRNG